MDQIGRYTVERTLARGGMAEVLLGKAVGPGGFAKNVVIKRILPELAENSDFVQMFLDEARLAAILNHPNVVQVFDFGQHEGHYFLAMEFIDGESLRNLLRWMKTRGTGFPPRLAAHILSGACEGVHYAHGLCNEHGVSYNIIHRDISPDNILLTRSGTPKIVDFGIAKAASSNTNTRSGVLKGKYAYMAPEQITGEGADRQLDVYALGVTLYELLTGIRPFQAENDLELLNKVLHGDVIPVSKRNPEVPEALEKIVSTAMARNRAERYRDVRSMQHALDDYLGNSGPRISSLELTTMIEEASLFFQERRARQPGPHSTSRPPPPVPSHALPVRPDATPPPLTPKSLTPKSVAPTPTPAPAAPQPAIDDETTIEFLTGSELTPVRPPRARWFAGAAAGLVAFLGAAWLYDREYGTKEGETAFMAPATVLVQSAPPSGAGPAKAPVVAGAAQEERPAAPVGTAAPVATNALEDTAPVSPQAVADAPQPAAPQEAQAQAEPEEVKKASAPRPEPKRTRAPTTRLTAETRAPRPATIVAQAAEPLRDGLLTVRTAPWCDVYLNGEHLGTTPLSRIRVPAGRHQLTLRNDHDGHLRKLTIDVPPGEEVRQVVKFTP